MLGCQDFCGYYDWTFGYVARRFGSQAVRGLWEEAIARDSQDHYARAARERGLRGLYDVWRKTGKEERCDWDVTLDEEKNVLRFDMHRCPSKGFLLDNDLQASEDYCDHCIGWIQPMLREAGIEVADHQHNHAGQCWWEMRDMHRPYQPIESSHDVRKDPRWNHGYLGTWHHGKPLPLFPQVSDATDAAQVLVDWFSHTDYILVLGGGGASAAEEASRRWINEAPPRSVIVTAPTYAARDAFDGNPLAVLIDDRPNCLEQVARRFHAETPSQRPLLMHAYTPASPMLGFGDWDLPRPVPILPLLIRSGLYDHVPRRPCPTTGVFLFLLAASLGKCVDVAGIEVHQDSLATTEAGPSAADQGSGLPTCHSEKCDLDHLQKAIARCVHPPGLTSHLQAALARYNPAESGAVARKD